MRRALFLVVLLPLTISSNAFSQGDEASKLMAKKVTTAPVVDGGVDIMWEDVPELIVALGETYDVYDPASIKDCAGCHRFDSDVTVTLKAIYTADRLYMLATWPDPTASFTRGGSWSLVEGSWQKPNPEQSEDRIALYWPIGETTGNPWNTGGCMAKCHMYYPTDEDPHVSVNGIVDDAWLEAGRADMWHSKAARGAALNSAAGSNLTVDPATHEVTGGTFAMTGFIDDKYVDEWSAENGEDGGRYGDAGSGAYSHNRIGDKSRPKYLEKAPLDYADAMVLTQAEIDAGECAGDPDTGVNDADAATYWPAYAALDAVVPERILKRPEGSRADIEFGAVWKNGMWTAEFARDLNTGNDDDVQFDTSQEYSFGVAAFENSRHGYEHRVSEMYSLSFGETVTIVAAYVGHDACKVCHAAIYDNYIQSGHPYKLNKVENGQPPTYPHSEVPSPPAGYTWDDITYVIGGFGWKARFIDQNGYIITGSAVQYNLATKGWVGYHSSEAPGTKPYTCGACHTTGWQTFEENGGVRQDGLEGMAGTFAAPGIECEGCHGPGSDHVSGPSKDNILKDTSKELCGQCHFRDSQHRIATSGGLIRHHEQYDELVNSPHRFMECSQCHDPHKSSKYALGGVTEGADCTSCHGDVEIKVPQMAGHDCTTCHMPKATKSAVVTEEFGDTGILGDIHAHTFKLNTNPRAMMFTPDGKFIELDADGNAIVTVDFACGGCHNGTEAPVQTVYWMFANAEIVHSGGTPVSVLAHVPGNEGGLTVSAAPAGGRRLHLRNNSPNPFNSSTMISYEITETAPVRLEIFAMTGQKVRTLVDFTQEPGAYQIIWDGRDADGRELATGIYLYRLQAGAEVQRERMTLLR